MKSKVDLTFIGAFILFLAAAGLTYSSIRDPRWIYISIIIIAVLLATLSLIAALSKRFRKLFNINK